MPADRARRRLQATSSAFGVLLVCFFLSGTTALVYEVVWLRMLGLVFGHTVHAITTVLAAFMAGLGLGSLLFGRRAAGFPDPIRVYGLLEIGIGISCALVPVLVWLASFVYLALYRALGASYTTFGLIQFALLFALLLVPTTLMGGTLPLLSQALVRREDEIGRSVGVLYAVNTFGAVAGTLLAGYGLLPALGNRGTIWIAAAANVAVGVIAIAYSRRPGPAGSRPAPEPHPARPSPVITPTATGGLAPWLVAAALGVSGAVSMIYEVSWTRALTLVIGSSTYAFTAMLAAFLLGIAGGAALYSTWWGDRPSPVPTFAAIQGAIGVAAIMVLLAFGRLPELFLTLLGHSLSPDFVQAVQLVVSMLVFLPTTLLIGATFPCAVAECARAPARVGQDVGGLYAANTLGAIAGAVLAGFILVPTIGAHASIKAGIAINLALAALLCVPGVRPITSWRWGVGAVSLAVAAAVILIPSWDPRMMSTGPAIYARGHIKQGQSIGLRASLLSDELLFYRDGPSATVAVTRDADHMALRVNGKVDASSDLADMPTQLMAAHLPLLLHPNPRTVLVIGLGSGTTAGAAAEYPIERLDVVEIEPAVVEASRFFTKQNGDVLKDRRLRLIIADGRNYLLTTRQRYDVIASEPSNPWIGGIASLFSAEYFALARRALAPGGIMAQWVQAYGLSPADFQMVVKTFGSVFPSISVWHTTSGDYLLLGRMEPGPIDLARIQARYAANPALRRDLELIGVRGWPGVLGYFMLSNAEAREYSAGASLNTDDRLPLEFSAPRALYLDTMISNWRLMKRFKVSELPEVTADGRGDLENAPARYAIGAVYLSRGVVTEALVHFQRALALDPTYVPALVGSASVSFRLGQHREALATIQQALAREPRNVDALLIAWLASTGLNDEAQAATYMAEARALRPTNELNKALNRLAPDGIPRAQSG
jgi:spermidine synthase